MKKRNAEFVTTKKRLRLTGIDRALLDALVAGGGAVVPRRALELKVWGWWAGAKSRKLDMAITRLRKNLKHQRIVCVPGEGYFI